MQPLLGALVITLAVASVTLDGYETNTMVMDECVCPLLDEHQKRLDEITIKTLLEANRIVEKYYETKQKQPQTTLEPDINECATNNGYCSSQATCANTVGSRTCTCNAGYTGTGLVCSDVNECATNNGNCSSQATCANTVGSRTCTCNAGYTGTGLVCSDNDECATNNGNCSPDATCANTVGSRTCTCNAGYTGTGLVCSDNNECATSNGNCSPDATCANTVGSRTCTCNAGYTGTGLECSSSHTRLVRGSSQYEGIVEVFHDGQWGTVCDDLFDDTDAGVVCASLGFSRTGTVVGAGRFGQTSQGTDPIWLDEVGCIGNESFIGACAHNGWGVHNCNHGEDVGVVCNP